MDTEALAFTEDELEYLDDQLLGRLATVDPSGRPQNNPVGFVIDRTTSQIVIGGHGMGQSRKFRNARAHPAVAFVVDDLASVDPWTPRGVEVRGVSQTLVDVDPPMPGFDREVIRITPSWIGSWGLQPGTSFALNVRRSPAG